ncbi:CapA family protein [Candidatus Saccharibacteria bacterium]|nr:CapA family protein [Candidatus Saccharibacteria bacterium]
MTAKKSFEKHFTISLITFLLVGALAFFGFQFITKTGIFKIPGVVYYDESLNDSETSVLQTIFTEEIELDKDVTISANESNNMPELSDGTYLYDIRVPVTDFYDIRDDIQEFDSSEYEYISINQLDFTKKLLSINDEYFLDSFNKGAIFRTITFDSEKFEEEIKPLVNSTFSKDFPQKSTVLSFAQTGVTALSRGMNAKMNSVNSGEYFAEKIGDFLSGFDLTHTSNESSFTDFATSSNICSDWRFKNTLTAIGLDIVELTGNHNQDCGNTAALDSIDFYNEAGIKIVGGGKSASEAAIPLTIDEKNSKLSFFAYNLSTGGATYGNTPGANQYYEEQAAKEIGEAKEQGNFVIVDVQYYECSGYASEYEDTTCDYANSAAGDQVGFFRHLIELGADVVVGTSAHQPQTFELYDDGVIYYGLGNLFFDQIWWPGTTRSLILSHYFYNNKLLQTKIVPTVYDKDLQTRLMDKETKQWFLNRLIKVKP